jgi:TatD DNase family protein
MQLIDVHCHLQAPVYNGILDRIVGNAREAGIISMICAATEPSDWLTVRNISKQYKEVKYALGIHPWYIPENWNVFIDNIRQDDLRYAAAVGEIGLDRKYSRHHIDIQTSVFTKFYLLARSLSLPCVAHCISAFDLLAKILKSIGPPYVPLIIHSFNGSLESAQQLSKFNVYFSIGGLLTHSGSKKRAELMKWIYPERFLLETDAPDIPPRQVKEKLHEPANILYNLQAASDIISVSQEKIAEKTTTLAKYIFRL